MAFTGNVGPVHDDLGRVIAPHAIECQDDFAGAHRDALPVGCQRIAGGVARGLLLGRRRVGQNRHVLAIVTTMRADHVGALELAAVLALDIGHGRQSMVRPAHVAA